MTASVRVGGRSILLTRHEMILAEEMKKLFMLCRKHDMTKFDIKKDGIKKEISHECMVVNVLAHFLPRQK
ncbi:MAG: hypothetical protein MPK62_01865 [Alphaproteobacteria bacterium]|nr:hypothetical protein [Alphaproteobacteria bacterium]MDA8029880.1 hypothetical protein [Alphaproteobacteria bacterium]